MIRVIYTSAILGMFLLACNQPCIEGEGIPTRESRALELFQGIENRSISDVNIMFVRDLKVGKATVESQENLLPYIKTITSNGDLIIDIEGCINTTENISIVAVCSELQKIKNEGSGKISTKSMIGYNSMSIVLEGSGDINLDLKGIDLRIEHHGTGDINLSGSADNLFIEHDGTGDINAEGLRTNHAEVVNSGTGDCTIVALATINATLTGSGDITYTGGAENPTLRDEGSGDIFHNK